ncbi:hypothetical protein GOODEAATRI_021175, partial [Goodea atripinnis]
RAFKRQCTEDGTWLEGACEPVTCNPPPPIFHGSYYCTDGFRFDSVCRLNCSDPAGNHEGGSAHTVRLLHSSCKQEGWKLDRVVPPVPKQQRPVLVTSKPALQAPILMQARTWNRYV